MTLVHGVVSRLTGCTCKCNGWRMPKTPNRVVRVDDDLWKAAQAKAAADERSVSDVIRAGLRRYVSRMPAKTQRYPPTSGGRSVMP